jgi:hypothetical protein
LLPHWITLTTEYRSGCGDGCGGSERRARGFLVRRSLSYAPSVAAALAALAPPPSPRSRRLLGQAPIPLIHEFPTASAESTAFSGRSRDGLLDVLFQYACVGLRSEGPEITPLSTLSRRQPINNPGWHTVAGH